jgi:hypothetical protein
VINALQLRALQRGSHGGRNLPGAEGTSQKKDRSEWHQASMRTVKANAVLGRIKGEPIFTLESRSTDTAYMI